MDKVQIYKAKLITQYLQDLGEVEEALINSPKKLSPELVDKMSNLLYMDVTPTCDVCTWSCREDDFLQPHCFMASLAATGVRHFLHLYCITDGQKAARKQVLDQIPRVILSLMEVRGQVAAQFGVNDETV